MTQRMSLPGDDDERNSRTGCTEDILRNLVVRHSDTGGQTPTFAVGRLGVVRDVDRVKYSLNPVKYGTRTHEKAGTDMEPQRGCRK